MVRVVVLYQSKSAISPRSKCCYTTVVDLKWFVLLRQKTIMFCCNVCIRALEEDKLDLANLEPRGGCLVSSSAKC